MALSRFFGLRRARLGANAPALLEYQAIAHELEAFVGNIGDRRDEVGRRERHEVCRPASCSCVSGRGHCRHPARSASSPSRTGCAGCSGQESEGCLPPPVLLDQAHRGHGAGGLCRGFLPSRSERRETFRADYYHGNWYLLALNAAKGRVERFALSSFGRIEGLGRTFDRPQNFDAGAHARQAFGIAGGEKPMKIRLFRAQAGRLHLRAPVASQPDAQETALRPSRVAYGNDRAEELVRWVLSWMPTCACLHPSACGIESP